MLAACRPAEGKFLAQSPVKLPEDLVSGVDNYYATLCGECEAGCGVVVRVIEGRAKKIEGNPRHPLNKGKLCVRGLGGVQATYHPDRIRRPMKATGPRGSGRFAEISWNEALDMLVAKLKPLKGQAEPDTVVIATDPINGHLGMVVGKFARSFGASHLQFEPMDLKVLMEATKAVFGTDTVPDFDLERSRYILSFGADFLMGWVSQVRHSRGYGEFRQGAGRARGTFVHVDSRFSGTAANADEWLPVWPGAEGKVALAMAYVIARDGLGVSGAAAQLFGPDPMRTLEPYRPTEVAKVSGVPADRIEKVAKEFASHQPGVAIGGGSAGAQTNGLFNLTAIYSLNHLVGSVGKAGGIVLNPETPFDADPSFKDTPFAQYGAAPLSRWQDLAGSMRAGRVQALLVRNADPAYGLPSAVDFKGAMEHVPFIASFSSFLDDTTYSADLVLPSHTSLEDWGDGTPNPGPGHQTVAFAQPVIRPFHDSRGFGDVILTLAQDLGMDKDLPWANFRDVLREGAQKLRGLNRGSVQGASFEAYWNDLLRQGGWWDPNFKSTAPVKVPRLRLENADPRFAGPTGEGTFHLVPFPGIGISDGRGAHLPWMQGTPDPITTATWQTWVEMNSGDAKARGIKEGDIVRVEGPNGSIEAPLYPNPALPKGVLAVPTGQGKKAMGRYAQDRGANLFAILAPQKDKDTGSLAWGATRVRLAATGKRTRIPKMEGSVVPIDYDGHVQVIKG